MSKTRIPENLRLAIMSQFGHRCAYCQSQQRISGVRLTVAHIIPESLGGLTEQSNLCLACWDCNLNKAAKIAVYDPLSQEQIRLFHPQQQIWSAHFLWSKSGVSIMAQSAIGRVTIEAIRLNRPQLVLARELWVSVGWHPPD